MEIYKDGCRTYVVITRLVPKKEALTMANKKLKHKVDMLGITTGRVKGDEVTIGVRGDVWVIWREYK